MSLSLLLSEAAPPAGGAALGQVIAATAGAGVLTAVLLSLGFGHRSGRVQLLERVGGRVERFSGLPAWASLPGLLAALSLLTAVAGMYWDISLHIDKGRDEGPLANPSHYLILVGLFGVFAAGWLAICLPKDRPGPAAVQIAPGWHAPVSGILIIAAGSFALLGFPLDDVWHRLFGQDVTLWGPTHIMLITGAGLSVLGTVGLQVEGRLSRQAKGARTQDSPRGQFARKFRLVAAFGGLLLGLSVYQGEFDFGVPQFRLVFQPVLIALASGLTLVAARIVAGPGVAIGAVAFSWVIRGLLMLLVGPVFGEVTPQFPLYFAEAALVELVAVVVSVKRPYRFGLAAGGAIGTVGLLAEWGWSQLWMPLPWPAAMLPEALLFTLPVALAAGCLGAFIGSALTLRPQYVIRPWALGAALASLAVVASVTVYLLQTNASAGGADVTLRDVSSGPQREVQATVRFDHAVDEPDWLTATAWQGGDPLVVDQLEEVEPGVWQTTEPIPVNGSWKSSIRLHDGRDLGLIPIYAPHDPAIPVDGIAAEARFNRGFVADSTFLQRERADDIPGSLWGVAIMVVVSLWLGLILLIGWTLTRLAGRGANEAVPAGSTEVPAPGLAPGTA